MLKWLGLVLLLFLIWFGADVAYVAIGSESDYVASADVIVVLGCNPTGPDGPSPCMIARGGHAADLYKKGYAHNVIATGNPRESTVLRGVLEDAGVPPDAIISDSDAYNTIQNIINCGAIMTEKGWHSAIIVTEPFHIKRSTLVAHDIWGQSITVYPSPAVDSKNWDSPLAKAYHVGQDSLSLMLYQVKSLIGQRD